MRLRTAVLLLLSVLPSGRGAFAESLPEATPPPVDFAAIAKRVVASLHPSVGEAAVLFYDPSYYPELTRAIQVELEGAGVHPVLTAAFDPPEVVGPLFASPAEAKKREEEAVALLRPVFEKAALFFWLPARVIAPDRRLERLVDASAARGIHFHWILPLEGKSAEEIAALSRLYERAILGTDYAALSKEQDRLIAALGGRSLRLTTPAGTDLRLRVPPDAWFHKNDGELPFERARGGRGARDREMELPAGALRLIPDAASVEGRLVVPRAPTRVGVAEDLVLDFERGRVVRWRAGRNETVLRGLWQAIGGDIDKVGEVVLGTSPLLVGSLPSGELPYFGYGSGYLRISLGDNWESGGALRTATGENLWLFLEGATLEAGATTLVRDGRILK